jgi:hypothetical protein
VFSATCTPACATRSGALFATDGAAEAVAGASTGAGEASVATVVIGFAGGRTTASLAGAGALTRSAGALADDGVSGASTFVWASAIAAKIESTTTVQATITRI